MGDFMDPRKCPDTAVNYQWYGCRGFHILVDTAVDEICKNTYHALGLKYTIYPMAITEICFFFRQFPLAAMNKIVGFMRIGI